MNNINHWTDPNCSGYPQRDFDRMDYGHDWWHSLLSDDCFCLEQGPIHVEP